MGRGAQGVLCGTRTGTALILRDRWCHRLALVTQLIGNTGSAYDRYDGNWTDYDAQPMPRWLSAGSREVIYDSPSQLGSINALNTRVASLESGSALSVSTTGTGNVVTAVTKSGTP